MRYIDVRGRRLSRIGLGTWQFGSREWGYGSDYAGREARAIVRRALELGVNVIDTAERYGFGASERIVGDAVAGRRTEVFLATKLFPEFPVGPMVVQRARRSARRLRVDRIDLYQVHAKNPVVGHRTTMRGMARVQRSGLVDQVGVSNYSLQQWQAADAALGSPVFSNQVRYSLAVRAAERDLLPWAQEAGRLVIAYSPLAQGLLSGNYQRDNLPTQPARSGNPLLGPALQRQLWDLVGVVREVAETHGASPSQIALAWLVHHPNVVAIPGARTIAQLEENVSAAELDLGPDDLRRLDTASAALMQRTAP